VATKCASQHASDIRIQHGVPLSEPERRDCCGGVRANARKRQQFVVGVGDLATVPGDERNRDVVQPQGPTRVTESTPCAHRFAGRIGRQ
jgi:hypothetical protein